MMHKDIIVVGAGISGIAAGYNLVDHTKNSNSNTNSTWIERFGFLLVDSGSAGSILA